MEHRQVLYIPALVFCCIVLLCRPAAAETTDNPGERENRIGVMDTLFWGPEIIVEAQRLSPKDELYNRPGFVALIDLEKRKNRMDDVASLLSRAVGVRIKQYGGLGSFATVSIRGSSSSQVQVYMDGVPLNDALTGTANLSDLALGDITRIEIFRGFSPTIFGSSSIGGTINLVSSKGDEWDGVGIVPSVQSRATAGSFDTRRYLVTLKSRCRRAGLHLHGGFMESRGDFDFFDDNATPENPCDDETSARANAKIASA